MSKTYGTLHTEGRIKTSCVVGPTQYAPAPANGDLNSHPDLSAWRSARMSVMRVIVLIRIRRLKFVGLPVPKICLIFGYGVKRPGDLDL